MSGWTERYKILVTTKIILVGPLILLSGDFRQILPVIPRLTTADKIHACLKSSNLWRHVKTLQLTTNVRALLQRYQSADVFSKQFLDIGKGKLAVDLEWIHHITRKNYVFGMLHFIKSLNI